MPYLPVDERRQTIVDAAIEVIAAEGLARATTRKIAERANAPLGALHYCFRNKDELIALVSERGLATFRGALEHVDPQEGVEATIRDSICALWQWLQDNVGLQLALTEGLMEGLRTKNRKKLYAAWDASMHRPLRDLIESAAEVDNKPLAVPVADVARFIIHRFDGLLFEYAATSDVESCERQVELLIDAVIALAAPPEGRRSTVRRSRRTKTTT